MKISELLAEMRNHRDAYQRDYDSSQTGFGRRGREDDEYHVPDPVDNRIAYKVVATVTTANGEEKKGVTVKTTGGPKHAQSIATKHLEDAGHQVNAIVSVHDLGPVQESATAGATSAANVGVGAVYKNKPAKAAKNKDGTVKNAQDMKTNLLTGGSIKR